MGSASVFDGRGSMDFPTQGERVLADPPVTKFRYAVIAAAALAHLVPPCPLTPLHPHTVTEAQLAGTGVPCVLNGYGNPAGATGTGTGKRKKRGGG